MLSLYNQLRHENTDHSRTLIEPRVLAGAADAELDRLVYGLYGLTEEEVKVLEGI